MRLSTCGACGKTFHTKRIMKKHKRDKHDGYFHKGNPKPLTLEQLRNQVKRLDPKLNENEESFGIALMLLAGIHVGADIKKISDFIKVPVKWLEPYEKRLRDQGVWVGENTTCDWVNEKTGAIAFWCDVLVAQGMLEKTKE